jgi:ribA/ribD-fused uncharacterized protein
MNSIKRLLSPSSDSNSPPKVKQRLDIDMSGAMNMEKSDMESINSHREMDTDTHTPPPEVNKCELIQPGAPGYFNDSMKALSTMLAPLSQLDALVSTVNSLMTSIEHAHGEAKEAKALASKSQAENKVLHQELAEVKRKHAQLESQQNSLNEKLMDQENYNRRANLVFEGIPQEKDENMRRVMIKQLYDMGVEYPESIPVVACHRLGGYKNPQPIIIRFQTVNDRQRVWNKRTNLKGTNVFLKENFCAETEKRRRVMLPIFKAARDHPDVNKCNLTPGGKLTINGATFTVNNLDQLPEALKPETISVKQNEKTYVFWGRDAVFSNFHPSKFTINGMVFNCSEQFLWFKAAEMFKDKDMAAAILNAEDPGKQKALSRNIKGFDYNIWKQAMEEIMEIGVKEKFLQNPHLQEKLRATRGKVIGEATGRDKVWGTGFNLYHANTLDFSKWTGSNLLGKTLVKIRDS